MISELRSRHASCAASTAWRPAARDKSTSLLWLTGRSGCQRLCRAT